VQPERQRGDDTEVSAAAADRPEEVLVRALVGSDHAPVREDDLGAEDVVDRKAELAREVADPAAEHQTTGTGRGDDPGGHR
jgi:hypothetical protein